MSYVIAAPEMMTAGATDLATIGADLSAAHMAAAPATIGLVPAAADEVSAGIAHLFSRYAEDFHGLTGKAAASHAQFVENLKASAASYTSVEHAIGSLLAGLRQDLWAWELQLPPALHSQLDTLTTDAQDALIIALVVPFILGLDTYFTLTDLLKSYPFLAPLLNPLIQGFSFFYRLYLAAKAFTGGGFPL